MHDAGYRLKMPHQTLIPVPWFFDPDPYYCSVDYGLSTVDLLPSTMD